jgi:3-methyl-2-oxobutanoate hydroxymethyltransferase
MSSQSAQHVKPVTVPDVIAAKAQGKKLVMVTAYDFPTAQLLDEAGIDLILVGDSLGMVVQGNDNCLSVTLEEMIYHTKMVSRAVKGGLVIADMPFMTYQLSPEQALENAGKMIQLSGAHAVKVEGGVRTAAAIEKIVSADIPVMGHVGLTPQSLHRLGGFRVQRDASKLIADAKAVEEAGAFSLVVEGVPADLGKQITQAVSIPTIGIGAGADCDGQVLVFHDVVNYGSGWRPKFVKKYADLTSQIKQAAAQFATEVRNGSFPGPNQQY